MLWSNAHIHVRVTTCICTLLAHNPFSLSAYPMMTHPPSSGHTRILYQCVSVYIMWRLVVLHVCTMYMYICTVVHWHIMVTVKRCTDTCS